MVSNFPSFDTRRSRRICISPFRHLHFEKNVFHNGQPVLHVNGQLAIPQGLTDHRKIIVNSAENVLCSYLKVVITQISFQFSRINTLWRGSLLKLSQRVNVPRNANYEMLTKYTKTHLFTQNTKELLKAHLSNIHPCYNQSIGSIWKTCTPL